MNLSDALSLIHDRHSEARDKGLYFQTADDPVVERRSVSVGGKRYTWFGSCGYLGLELDPRLADAAADAAHRYGTQFASSRGYISAPLYDELERSFDEIFDGHTLICPLTTIAHQIALPSLATERDCIVLDHQCHATIQYAARFAQTRGTKVEVVRHDRLEQMFELLPLLAKQHRTVWVCVDGVYSMFGDLAPVGLLQDWLDLADNIRLYVDDAHGMSWAGKHGRGSFLDRMPMHPRMVLATTFAKAAGAGGAALVFPNREELDFVRMTAGPVVFSGPLQPPMQGALLASARIHLSPEITALQEAMRARVDQFNTLTVEAGLPQIVVNESPIAFLRMGPHGIAQEVARRVMDDGYMVNVSMFPSVPQRRSGLRIALTATHTAAEVDGLVASLARHVPEVMQESGLSRDELDTLFEGAVPEAGSGKLMKEAAASRRFLQLVTGRPAERAITGDVEYERDPASLEVVEWASIRDVPRDLWDDRMGSAGCVSWDSLAMLEKTLAPERALAAEESWTFRYVGIRDPDSGRLVALTSLNSALQKDDMFLRPGVSQELERRRVQDPYLLTSRFVGTGSFFSEGEHVWLDRDGPWKAALARLIEEARRIWEEQGAAYLVIRDMAADDAEAAAVFRDAGLVPAPMMDSHHLDLTGLEPESWVASLSKRTRKLMRQILDYRSNYRVERWGTHTGERLDDVTAAHCYALYEQLAERNLRINGFKISPRILQALQDNPAWEIITLRHVDCGDLPVAWYASHRHGDHDMPLMCGVDSRYIRRDDSAYRQLLLTIVFNAMERGADQVHLGMDAAVEKRRLGAESQPRVAWTLVRGDHNAAELETIIAELNTRQQEQGAAK